MLGTCCLKLRIINLSSIKINTIKELYPPILTDLFLGLSNARKYKTFHKGEMVFGNKIASILEVSLSTCDGCEEAGGRK